jgi:protocatechuate 3,4-dioxygenase beta subunit
VNTRIISALVLVTLVAVAGALFVLQAVQPAVDDVGGPSTVQEQSRERPTILPAANSGGDRTAIDISPVLPPITEVESPLIPENLPAIVMGRVVGTEGQPIFGAAIEVFARPEDGVKFRLEPMGMRSQTDAAGLFDVIVPGNRTVVIEARSNHAAPAHVQVAGVSPGEARDLGDLMLKSGTALHGTVRNDDGRPLHAARVTVFDASMVGDGPLGTRPEGEAITDSAGTYRIDYLGHHQYSIHAELDGYSPMTSTLAFVLGGDGTEWEQNFTLWPAEQILAGQVVSADGTGIPDVELRLIKRQTSGLNNYFTAVGQTDEHGQFLFDEVPAGLFEVKVDSPDWYTDQTVRLEAPRTNHSIIVHPALTVFGQLSVTGAMPKQFTVTVRPDGRTGARLLKGSVATITYTQTDPPGSFVFGGLRPGAYSFQVVAPNYAMARSQDVILGSAQFSAQVVIPLRMGASLTGRVVMASAEELDLSIGSIELHEAEWDAGTAIETAFPTPPIQGQKKRLDSDGRFMLQHVPAGTYVVTARVASAPPVHVRDVTLVEGETIDLGDLTVIAGGRVSGYVRGSDGQPATGATVRFTGHSFHLQVTTLNDGSFLAPGMPPGRYDIEVSPPGLFAALKQHATGEVVVASDQESMVELTLTERSLGNP